MASSQLQTPDCDLLHEWVLEFPTYMMTSSNGNIFVLLALCDGNPPVTGGFPSQRPVTRSFDVFIDLGLNKQLSKQSKRWWRESHRAHYDVIVMRVSYINIICEYFRRQYPQQIPKQNYSEYLQDWPNVVVLFYGWTIRTLFRKLLLISWTFDSEYQHLWFGDVHEDPETLFWALLLEVW